MKTILLFLIFISCTSADEIKYAPKETAATDSITKLINDERKNRSLNELKAENLLTELSKAKAIQMESDKEINHNGFTNLEVQTGTFSQIVGYGYKSEVNLFNSYMTSSEHKEKILGNFTHIGSYTYKSYNCILFAKY
jgi:uncharacterized protein YkwD